MMENISKLNRKLASAGIDSFIAGILLMVVLAYFFPQPGLVKKPFSLEDVAAYGVAGIFFFYGLKLNFDKLKKGLANWKLHIVVQTATFLLFPLLALSIKPLFHSETDAALWTGIFYLCALPSTVSSSVVMVSIAGGNIPAAIFNASISSLIGIFMTPFWIKLFITQGSAHMDSTTIVSKLLVQVLIPVLLGIALNSRYGAITERNKKKLKTFDQVIILIIIYTSFCHSFSLGIFKGISWLALILLAVYMLVLFVLVICLIRFIARLLGFDAADSITAMFCGSKKSLVHGTVMSRIIFAGSTSTGIILLPLMLYHALQLVAASIMAKRMATNNIDSE
jgi:sodium/bile acid cotransporter 7